MPGQAPKEIQGPGEMFVGIDAATLKVRIQFTDPDWWCELNPTEARGLAALLCRKADEAEELKRRN